MSASLSFSTREAPRIILFPSQHTGPNSQVVASADQLSLMEYAAFRGPGALMFPLEEDPVSPGRKVAACEKGLKDAQLEQMQANREKEKLCVSQIGKGASLHHSSRAQSGALAVHPMEGRGCVTYGPRYFCQLILKYLLRNQVFRGWECGSVAQCLAWQAV